jgi:cytosol alanyl aminopeptidase
MLNPSSTVAGRVRAIASGVLLFSACMLRKTPAPAPPAAPEAPTVMVEMPALPGVRLEPDVRPIEYALELDFVGSASHFHGRASIQVELLRPSDHIVLHAEGLDFDSVRVESAHGDQTARVAAVGASRIAVLLPQAISGAATLQLEYRGPVRDWPLGVYRAARQGHAGIYTQSEPTGARRVFPCFDEPGFKTPFALTLKVPHDELAVANAPVISRSTAGKVDVVRFAPTPPLPTYLVAFAVGHFDEFAAPIGDLSHRILTLPGAGDQAGYAAEQAPIILDALTRYLGRPYPYAKLDQLAAPVLSAGAMENAGLIIYREDLLLAGPDASQQSRVALQQVMAHELAHMWFGDQVTPRWWDDLWLSESLATWLAAKVQAQVAPRSETTLADGARMLNMLERDAGGRVGPVRRSINGPEDIEATFADVDVIYDKGSAVLSMLEAWLGEETFQNGLRSYLQRFDGGSASMSDLASSLEAVSGKPVGKVLASFLEQPGAPLLSFEIRCDGKQVSVHHRQTHYLAAAAMQAPLAPSKPDAGWPVPACLHLFSSDQEQTVCSVFEPTAGDTPLAVDFCPQFFHPNASERGYYQWQLAPAQLAELAIHQRRLNLAERSALPMRARSAFESGAVPAEILVAVLRASALDEHSAVLDSVLRGLSAIDWAWPEKADREPLVRFARELLTPALSRLGFWSRPSDSRADRAARPLLLHVASRLGDGADILAAANQLTRSLLANPGAIAIEDATALLPNAARRGDAALFSKLQGLVERNLPPALHTAVAYAFGSFEDPELLSYAWDQWLSGRLPWGDFWTLEAASRGSEHQHERWWSWYLAHADAVIQRLSTSASWLPWTAALACTVEGKAAARAHFAGDRRFGARAQTALAEALGQAERCRIVREQRGASLVAALK